MLRFSIIYFALNLNNKLSVDIGGAPGSETNNGVFRFIAQDLVMFFKGFGHVGYESV